jgi:hypothetical protein
VRFINWNNVIDMITLSSQLTVTTIRQNGSQQIFQFRPLIDSILQSIEDIPEPHEFTALVNYKEEIHKVEFKEINDDSCSDKGGAKSLLNEDKQEKYHIDNNFRAAVLHVIADGFVSMITILSVLAAGLINGAWFLNPVVGILGSVVIFSWALQLIQDTVGTLLDMSPDPSLNDRLRQILESDNQTVVVDLHLWKLGPGKLGVIVSLLSNVASRTRQYYWNKLKNIKPLAHTTIEIYYNLPNEDAPLLYDHDCGFDHKPTVFTYDHDHSHGYEDCNCEHDTGLKKGYGSLESRIPFNMNYCTVITRKGNLKSKNNSRIYK